MSPCAIVLAALSLLGCSSSPGSVLVYTRTAGFRHDSIPAAVEAVRTLATSEGLRVEHSEDPSLFTDEGLRAYKALVFLHSSGDMLDDAGTDALDRFVRGGGGYLGIHAAADALHGSSTYRELVGALFAGHPAAQTGLFIVEDPGNAAARELPNPWSHFDEFYEFTSNPRGSVHVVLRADETSYSGGGMGADHPIAWCHRHGEGRVFYTALGHPIEAWSDPVFLGHVRGGLRIATGAVAADCDPN